MAVYVEGRAVRVGDVLYPAEYHLEYFMRHSGRVVPADTACIVVDIYSGTIECRDEQGRRIPSAYGYRFIWSYEITNIRAMSHKVYREYMKCPT